MNNFKNYILEMKKLAQIKKIKWDIEVDKNGVVLSEDRWNLNEIIGNNTRPFYYLSSFERLCCTNLSVKAFSAI